MNGRLAFLSTLTALLWLGPRFGRAAQADADLRSATELKKLSLEELANIEVTSVSRTSERVSSAPSAIYVLTPEDLQRSGATSLPEALRLAPNLQVAQIDSHQWAISARGINNT